MNAIGKALQKVSYRHRVSEVFDDFCAMAAIAVSNACDKAQFDKRESEYMRIVKKYEKEEVDKFPEILGRLQLEFNNGIRDVLGEAFGELEIHNSHAGQFFTPFELSRLIAAMTIDENNLTNCVSKDGFMSFQEPACGAGGMVLAAADRINQLGFDCSRHLHCIAVDVDIRCVHMSYLQLSLAGIPAVVVHGNTLTLEVYSQWFTPVHVMGFWQRKIESVPVFAQLEMFK